MNILLVRPTDKARQNFETRIAGMDISVYECSMHDEARDLLDSRVMDMVLIFLDKIDTELVWIFGLIMDYDNIRIVGLMENEEVDINFDRDHRHVRKSKSKFIYNQN